MSAILDDRFYIEPEVDFEGKPELDQWWTPPWLAKVLVEITLSCVAARRRRYGWPTQTPLRVLEPSAGVGSITRHFPDGVHVVSVDVDPRCSIALQRVRPENHEILIGDFLETQGPLRQRWFDATTMNAPYSKPREGLDLDFLVAALTVSDAAVALVRSSVMHRKKVHQQVWSRLAGSLTFEGYYPIVGRPDFGGEYGAKTDYTIIAVGVGASPTAAPLDTRFIMCE